MTTADDRHTDHPSFLTGGPSAPVFDAPWQAEAFALTVALNESGHLPWSQWADYLSAALREAGIHQEARDTAGTSLQRALSTESNDAYYRAWLAALEQVVRERQWIGPLQLGARREAIRAYNRVADQSQMFAVRAQNGSLAAPGEKTDQEPAQ